MQDYTCTRTEYPGKTDAEFQEMLVDIRWAGKLCDIGLSANQIIDLCVEVEYLIILQGVQDKDSMILQFQAL